MSLLYAVEVGARGRCPRLAGSASKGLMGQMPWETTENVRCSVSRFRDHGGGAGGSSLQFRGPGLADILSTVRAAVTSRIGAHPIRKPNGCKMLPSPPHITGPPCPPANFCSPSAKSCRCGANHCKSLQIAAENRQDGTAILGLLVQRPVPHAPFQGLRDGSAHHEVEAADEVALSSALIHLLCKG